MEPLIKNENYSYSFYRRMIENIKQTKDKQNPDDMAMNYVSNIIFQFSIWNHCWKAENLKSRTSAFLPNYEIWPC